MHKGKIYFKKDIQNYNDLVEYIASEYGEKIAFKYKEEVEGKKIIKEITYTQFYNDIKKMSIYLSKNIGSGSKVSVIAPNRYEWCVVYLATVLSNMIIVPLDKSLPENEIVGLVNRSKADCIVFDKKYLDVFKNNKFDNLKQYICFDNIQEENIKIFSNCLEEGMELIKSGFKEENPKIIPDNQMGIMLFTSGTTSIAKAVMLSQKNICANLNDLRSVEYFDTNDTFLSFLPLHHTFECTAFLLALSSGSTIAFCEGIRHAGDNLKEFDCSILVCVPLMIEAMYKKIQEGIRKQKKEKLVSFMRIVCRILLKFGIDIRRKVFKDVIANLGSLRLIISGAAALSKEAQQGLVDFGIETIQGYGLTECSPVLSAEHDGRHKIGSVGLPMPTVEVDVEDPDKHGRGELIARGPNIMLGYYENEEATQEVMKNGWFHTGDLGYIDKKGFIFITGRKKTVIVLKNGKNIFPEEQEKLVNVLPFVEESMIYPIPSRDDDIDLACKIVYKPDVIDQMRGDMEIKEYIWQEIKKVNKHVPPYKYIRSIIITDEPLIKTTTQKIKRFEEMKKIENSK